MHELQARQFLRKIIDQCKLSHALSLEIERCSCKWLSRNLKKIEEKNQVVIHEEDFVVYFFGMQDDKEQAKREVEMLLSERDIVKKEKILHQHQSKALQGKLPMLRKEIYDNFLVTLEYLGESIILRGQKKVIDKAATRLDVILQELQKQFQVKQLQPRICKMLKAFPGTKQMLLKLDIELLDEQQGIITGHKDRINDFFEQMEQISKEQEKTIEVDGLDLITKEQFKRIKQKAQKIHFCEVTWSQDKDDCAVIEGFFPQNVKSELQKLKLQKTILIREEEEEKLNQEKIKLQNDLRNQKNDKEKLKNEKEKLKNDKEKLQNEVNKIKIPDTWSPMGGNKYLLVDIAKGTEQFRFVSNRFNNTLNNQIVRVQRIQNPQQWKRVKFQEEFIRSQGRDPCVRYMFHGTKNNPPHLFYDNHIGFDFRFSLQGAWGVGSYFAHNSSYSGGGYQHRLPNGNNCMFLVYVVQGMPYKTDGGNYRIPPFINGHNGPRYDSVSSKDGTIVIVYEHGKAYPYYLIEYK